MGPKLYILTYSGESVLNCEIHIPLFRDLTIFSTSQKTNAKDGRDWGNTFV